MTEERALVNHYGASYEQFASKLYGEIRTEAFGEDIGQNGWLTADEQDLFISWLRLGADRRLLDVACGSGGPTLRIAKVTGCRVHGIDIHEYAVAAAQSRAKQDEFTERATSQQADAGKALAFPDKSFDAIICVDSINHLADRAQVLREWARVLRPGGRLVFTDPIVVTGPLTNTEIAIRSSIGIFLFVPPRVDERLIEAAGLDVGAKEDRTQNMASVAERWRAAQAAQAEELRRIEGKETYEGQQRFFEVAGRLAKARRLSRFAYRAGRGGLRFRRSRGDR